MNHYESTPALIGKHFWRIIVYSHDAGKRYTEYQFKRDDGCDYWHEDKRWPSYNSNDGMYMGCPKSIAAKVYYPNEVAIKAALNS